MSLRIGDRVIVPGGEIGTIIRECGHSQIDWIVELDAKPELNIPSTELPFYEAELCLLKSD